MLFGSVIKNIQHNDKMMRSNSQKYLKSDHPQDNNSPICAITRENKGITFFYHGLFFNNNHHVAYNYSNKE